tara:strand:- start:1087 stop:1812 length:726 start_codon:yes stop_codon:yes gene_type:complete
MNLDILAFGSHPDDVELGSAGTLAKSIAQGKSVVIIDLTQGELGTRGNINIRKTESSKAASILAVKKRENLKFKDGFFVNDETHQRLVIKKIREYRPNIVICNAHDDRHIDHGKGNRLVNDACFLSGLTKIVTKDLNGKYQDAWRPKIILEYIQWNDVKPDVVIDIAGYLDIKMKAISAYSSQFFDPNSTEAKTPISSKNFYDSVSYRAKNFGRLIGTQAGEGFTSRNTISIGNLDALIHS